MVDVELDIEFQIALDALLAGRHDFDDRHAQYLNFAVDRIRQQTGAIARHPWLWKPQRPDPDSLHGYLRRGDIHCLFCGELVLQDVQAPRISAPLSVASAREHVTHCALEVLTGRRKAALQ